MVNVGNSFASSLDITYKGTGISFGNSKRINGVRFNLVDHEVEKVNGLNLTFWKPKDNPSAVMNGLAFGLVGLDARELNGFSFGGVGLAGEQIRGFSLGTVGLAVGDVDGIAIGGVGLAAGDIDGVGEKDP